MALETLHSLPPGSGVRSISVIGSTNLDGNCANTDPVVRRNTNSISNALLHIAKVGTLASKPAIRLFVHRVAVALAAKSCASSSFSYACLTDFVDWWSI